MSSHHLWKIRPQLKQPQWGFPWKLNLMWPLISGHTLSYHPLSFLAKHMTPCETVLVSYWLTCLSPHENGRSKRAWLFDSSLVHLQCLEQCLIHIRLSMHIFEGAKVKVLIAQLCPTFCDPVDCSPPGSSVRGILQARILEWVAIPFFRGSPWPGDWTQVFCTACRFFYPELPGKPYICVCVCVCVCVRERETHTH